MTRRIRSPFVYAALAAASVAAGLVVAVPGPPAAAAVAASTEWVPAPDPTGQFRAAANDRPFVSADGRWVAFQSAPAPTRENPDPAPRVFLADRATDTVVPVAGGVPGVLPTVSADGCFVVFVTDAAIDPTDPQGLDVYRWTRDGCPDAGRTVLVSRSPDGGGPLGQVALQRPSISDDGSRVAFAIGNSRFSIAAWAQAAGGPDTAFQPLDLARQVLPRTSESGQPAISGDGRFLAVASRLVPGQDTPSPYPRVYRWTLDSGLDPGAFVAVSGDGLAAVSPAIDRDGTLVAFSSIPFATEFVQWQVQAVDLASGSPAPPILVSQRGGQPGNANSGNNAFNFEQYPDAPGVAVSGDGLSVAFTTLATDLLGQPGPVTDDVLVWFLVSGGLQPLSSGTAGQPVNASSYSVSLSFTGRAATFDGFGIDQLVASPPGGTAGQFPQAFVRERQPELTLTPALDFGVATVGQSTDTRSVEVRNTGLTPLVVSTVGGSVGNVVVDAAGCAGRFLSPSETCLVTVRVQVTAGGLLDATVVATAAGPFVDAFPVTGQAGVRVTGVVPTTPPPPTTTTRPPTTTAPPTTTTRPPTTTAAPRPVLSLNPPVADFGTIALGTPSSPAVFVLRNAGAGPVTIAEAGLSGPDAADFSLVTSCRGAVLAPGASCSSNVVATPSAVGPRNASLVFAAAGTSAVASLTVTGADRPSLVANPAVGASGSVTALTGRNFAPGVTVTLQWLDGRPVGTAVAGPDGSFALPVVILATRLGTEAIIAVDPVPVGAAPAAASFLVVQGTATPPAAGPLRTLFRG